MSWWKEVHELNTRNGHMRLVKLFGMERLLAQDKTQQSGTYMNGVWKTALHALPSSFKPTSIVFFGVGTGGALHILAKRFPQAHIVGIEWDSTLCNLARERLKKEKNIVILEVEAENWSKNMEYADLVCIDLFTGTNVAPCVRDITFTTTIMKKSHIMYINVYTHTGILDEVDNNIARLPRKRLQYHASHIGMYGSPHVRK